MALETPVGPGDLSGSILALACAVCGTGKFGGLPQMADTLPTILACPFRDKLKDLRLIASVFWQDHV